MRQYLKQALFIVIISVFTAFVFNYLRPSGQAFSLTAFNPFSDAKKTAQEENLPSVEVTIAFEYYNNGSGVFVDARPPELFKVGRIPGSFNIPEKNNVKELEQFRKVIPIDQPVVVYCDGQECLASVHTARQLKKDGYLRVYVFFGGWQQWQEAAHPIEWD